MKSKLTGQRCACRACGLVFTTARNFDAHRTGAHDLHAPGYGRRCRTLAELQALAYSIGSDGAIRAPAPAVARNFAPSLQGVAA